MCVIAFIAALAGAENAKFSALSVISPAFAEDNLAEGLRLYQLQQYPQAATILIPLAESGELRAIPPVIFMYYTGYNLTNGVFQLPFLSETQFEFARSKNNYKEKVADLLNKYGPAITAKAEKGEAWAQYFMGMQGRYEANSDQAKSLSWFQLAAAKGFSEAQITLGDFYADGSNGLEKDEEQALDYYLKAAQQGDIGGMWQVGSFLSSHDISRLVDDMNAEQWLTKASDMGHIGAGFRLAEYYTQPKTRDLNKVVAIYQNLINLKAVVAYSRLGQLYVNGTELPKNVKSTRDYYQKGIENGDVGSIWFMSFIYNEGKVMPANYRKAYDCLKLLADSGYDTAMFMIGRLYQEGKMTDKKALQLTIDWYAKAAEKGHKLAIYLLADIYDSDDMRKTVTTDKSKAMYYYKMGAEFGQSDCQFEYGKAIANGDLGAKDDVVGLMWIHVSLTGDFLSNDNLTLAQKARNKLAVNLSEEEQNLAKSLAVKCINANFKGCGRQLIKRANDLKLFTAPSNVFSIADKRRRGGAQVCAGFQVSTGNAAGRACLIQRILKDSLNK
eukprot:Em0263g12a